MKKVNVKVLGVELSFGHYESADEADKHAGRVGACVDEANSNLQYRGASAAARTIICAVVAAATGVKRKETPALDAEGKPRTNAKGEPITKTSETEQVYVDRALAAKGLTLAQITPDIKKAAAAANDGAGLSVDIRAQERKPAAPKKLAQKFLDSVRSLIADGKIDKFKKAYEKLVGQPLAADASEETLGWALKEYTDIKAEQARSQF